MKQILFVCHGNICRSAMAEYLMKYLVQNAGMENQFRIASAATSTEEIGNPIYPPARRKLAEHNIHSDSHAARQMIRADYSRFDLLVGMDSANIRNMTRIACGDPDGKIVKLLNLVAPTHPRYGEDVADPWYTGNFEATWQDVLSGCQALLKISHKIYTK